MKKAFGILLLLVALFSAVKVVSKLAHSGPGHTGNRSYDAGHTVGFVTAPLLLGGLGLWLLFGSGDWARSLTKPLLWSAGIMVVLVLVAVLFSFIKGARSDVQTWHPPNSPGAPGGLPTSRPGSPAPSSITPAFALGEKIQAHWAGRWIPGSITRTNPGGFTFMVQLDDAHFPHPIILSAGQLRKK